jgi:hypothetical protein
MTNEEHERFTAVMMRKYRWQLDAYPTEDEALEGIIGGVIADTSLLLDGVVSLDRWEQALDETKNT